MSDEDQAAQEPVQEPQTQEEAAMQSDLESRGGVATDGTAVDGPTYGTAQLFDTEADMVAAITGIPAEVKTVVEEVVDAPVAAVAEVESEIHKALNAILTFGAATGGAVHAELIRLVNAVKNVL